MIARRRASTNVSRSAVTRSILAPPALQVSGANLSVRPRVRVNAWAHVGRRARRISAANGST